MRERSSASTALATPPAFARGLRVLGTHGIPCRAHGVHGYVRSHRVFLRWHSRHASPSALWAEWYGGAPEGGDGRPPPPVLLLLLAPPAGAWAGSMVGGFFCSAFCRMLVGCTDVVILS